MRHRVILVFALILTLAGTSSAWQDPNAAAAPPAAGAGAAPAAPNPPATAAEQPAQPDPCSFDLQGVEVTRVRPVPPFEEPTGRAASAAASAVAQRSPNLSAGETRENLPVVELRDTVAVTIPNLRKLLKREECLEKQAGGERNIVLYLDRRPLPDVIAQPPSDPDKDSLMFPLSRTEASRDVWTYLLGRPRLSDRKVEVSIGIDNQFAMPSRARVYLRVIPRRWFYFWLLIFGAFVIGFFILARRSDVLRDPLTPPAGARPPYSLARTQAAWWFFLILAAYLLIGMVTGDFSTSITGTTMVLLGISAGTAAGSAFIDASKSSRASKAQDNARAQAMWTQIQNMNTDITTLESTMRTNADPALAQQMADKAALRTEKLSMYRKLTNQSESFLLDVLSDSGGVNFHRFQALAWTMVLGFIFVGHVYRDLAMPQFSDTLLGLMGISSGTYLSLKIPENDSPDPEPPTPAAPRNPPPTQ